MILPEHPFDYVIFFVHRPISDDDVKARDQLMTWLGKRRSVPKVSELQQKKSDLHGRLSFTFQKVFHRKNWRFENGLRQNGYMFGGPFLGFCCDSITMLRVGNSYVNSVVMHALAQARDLGLVAFDLYGGFFYRPDRIEDIEMSVARRYPLVPPNLRQICDHIDRMTPRVGPASMKILMKSNQSYITVNGGDGKFTCKWREVFDKSFKHWLARRPGQNKRQVLIKTTERPVTVNANERLSAKEVKQLITAFVRQEPWPKDLEWRDISDRYDPKTGRTKR